MTEHTSLKIKQIMKLKKIGNRALAERSGLPLGTLNKIIYGDTKSPTLDNMQAIAKALGCTLDDFVDDSTRPDPDFLSSAESSLLSVFRDLNDEGQQKVYEYTVDLIASGRYIKSRQDGMVGA